MELLCVAVDPYLPEGNTHFFRPSDKFYFELELWETDFEDRLETYVKVSDLRYAVERGFDLKKHVMGYMNSLPLVPGYQEPIRSAFRRYIKFMRTGVGKSEPNYKDWSVDILGTEEMIELFCQEVQTYNLQNNEKI